MTAFRASCEGGWRGVKRVGCEGEDRIPSASCEGGVEGGRRRRATGDKGNTGGVPWRQAWWGYREYRRGAMATGVVRFLWQAGGNAAHFVLVGGGDMKVKSVCSSERRGHEG
eukprot:scaffold11931_cov72-Isochrysis_galbana.AAC.2